METHPQKAEDMPLGNGDLSVVVRTIDPILDQLFDGAIKGALYADDLVDIATRIRTILHEAVARQGSAESSAGASQAAAAGPASSRGAEFVRGAAGSAAAGGATGVGGAKSAGGATPAANVPGHASGAGG